MIGEGEVGLQSTEAQKEIEKEVVVEGFTRHRPIVMSVHMEEVQLAGGGGGFAGGGPPPQQSSPMARAKREEREFFFALGEEERSEGKN